jgi:hypothetical protein
MEEEDISQREGEMGSEGEREGVKGRERVRGPDGRRERRKVRMS